MRHTLRIVHLGVLSMVTDDIRITYKKLMNYLKNINDNQDYLLKINHYIMKINNMFKGIRY